jgi:hypothetical protein
MRVFINAIGVDVPGGGTVLDAVRAWRPEEADAISRGERVVTDSRGLPVSNDTAIYWGAIYRTVSNRALRGEAEQEQEQDG